MKKEVIATGKTIEAAIANGADELGVDASKCTYEVLEQPKSGFLGIGQTPAKVKVICEQDTKSTAVELINTIIRNMDIMAEAEIVDCDEERNDLKINIKGEDAHILIGYHGDTLDSLQYLVNLACSRSSEADDDMHISIDAEGYRAKREETLRQLARRMADKVLKYKKNFSLEPMNAYERRIIHSEIQLIEGVTTTSVGAGSNRRVVVMIPGSKEQQTGNSRRRRPRGQTTPVIQTRKLPTYDYTEGAPDIDSPDEE